MANDTIEIQEMNGSIERIGYNFEGETYSESSSNSTTTRKELAIARPVISKDQCGDENDKNNDNSTLPAAVEFDVDQKHSSLITNQRKSYRKVLLGTFLVAVIGVSIATGIIVSKRKKSSNKEVNDSRVVTIQEFLTSTLPYIAPQTLRDRTNPYAKAYNWMVHDDPQRLLPSVNATFLQRFYLVYYYYATSIKKDWDFCYPIQMDSTNEGTKTKGVSRKRNGQYTCRTVFWSKFQGVYESTFSRNYWLSEKSECSWTGILCDVKGHVTEITSIGVGQTGEFPEYTNELPFLNTLQIMSGNLSGTLPDINYKGLQSFGAASNQFTGSIPNKLIRDSRMLSVFNVPYNQFSGFSLGNVTSNIKRISIDSTDYGQIIVNDEIERLQSLFYFDLAHCNVRGKIPSALFNNLPYFSILGLTGNRLTGSIPDMQAPRLLRLLLDQNQLSGSLPDSLYRQTFLDTLQLAGNQLTGTISDNLQKLSNIGWLSLDSNRFTGTLPPVFGKLSTMSEFSMVGTNITGQVPVELCRNTYMISKLEADCLIDPISGLSEIFCPYDCCTLCCDPNGENCAVHST